MGDEEDKPMENAEEGEEEAEAEEAPQEEDEGEAPPEEGEEGDEGAEDEVAYDEPAADEEPAAAPEDQDDKPEDEGKGEEAADEQADEPMGNAEGDEEAPQDEAAQDDAAAQGEAKEAAPQEPEEPKEPEQDAAEDERPRIAAGSARINESDTTLNVMPSCGGKVLMGLSDGGFQHLMACARGTTGLKAGRYFFEARMVEMRTQPGAQPQGKGQKPASGPRPKCCLGFSTSGSSLFLGDGAESIGFDSDGNLLSREGKTAVASRFNVVGKVMGILLNLDPESSSANTVSLFRDGVRACKPQPLPEGLKGKALFPTLNYMNMTLQVNFGPEPLAPLPFKCRMVQDAAGDDVQMVVPREPPSGQREVLYPVGLPDEGTFDWLDDFLKENPHYTELSARSLLEWGVKSGLHRSRGEWRNCNDRPTMDFGIQELDTYTIERMIQSLAPQLQRDFVVMEVRNNLMLGERQKSLANFDGFKKVAMVVMGEPPAAYKAKMQEAILADKREKAVGEAKRKKAQEERTRREGERQNAERKRAAKANGEQKKEPAGEGEEKEKEEDENGGQEKEAPEESLEEAVQKAKAAVELTPEEKAMWFRTPTVEDMTKKDLGQAFTSFSLPGEAEGFDEVKYIWQGADECAEYLKVWVSERKQTQRVEDLQPGKWFHDKMSEWSYQLQEWGRRQNAWRSSSQRRRESEVPMKRRRGATRSTSKAPEEEKAMDVDAGEKAEEKDGKDEAKEAAPEGEGSKPEEDGEEKEKEAKAEPPAEINAEDLEVFHVKDVCDIGNGEPLFAHITWEDWAMLSLRFELHVLVHAFQHDVNDPERVSFHQTHLGFYYNKYFKKPLNVKSFGVNDTADLLELVKDTMEVVPKKCLMDPQLAYDTPLENFVRLTEDHRRERQRRIDLGDMSAVLKIERQAPRGGAQKGGQKGGHGGGYQQHRGSGYQSSRTAPPPPVGSHHGGRAKGAGSAHSRYDNTSRGPRDPRADPRDARGGPGRMPPSAPPARYAAPPPGRDMRGSTGGSSGGYSGGSRMGSGGSRDAAPRGAPPRYSGREPPPQAPPAGGKGYGRSDRQPASYGGAGGAGGGQKRPYDSGSGGYGAPYTKQPRSDSYGGGGQPRGGGRPDSGGYGGRRSRP